VCLKVEKRSIKPPEKLTNEINESVGIDFQVLGKMVFHLDAKQRFLVIIDKKQTSFESD
jgi:hypothetical protein